MKRVNITLEQKSYSNREEIRALRTNLQFCGDDKPVILMTSCLPGEGKTSVSIELTEAIADMGKTVILVDADMKKSVNEFRSRIWS